MFKNRYYICLFILYIFKLIFIWYVIKYEVFVLCDLKFRMKLNILSL